MGIEYVRRKFKFKCSHGTQDNTLNLPLDHGVIFGADSQPLMNANDHMSMQHIIHCGMCRNYGNPMVLAKVIAMNMAPGLIIQYPLSLLTKTVMLAPEIAAMKCLPLTVVAWVVQKKTHIIEGAPALQMDSKLPCFYGGIIEIVEEVQEEEVAADSEQEIKEEWELTRSEHIKHQLTAMMSAKAERMMKLFAQQ